MVGSHHLLVRVVANPADQEAEEVTGCLMLHHHPLMLLQEPSQSQLSEELQGMAVRTHLYITNNYVKIQILM